MISESNLEAVLVELAESFTDWHNDKSRGLRAAQGKKSRVMYAWLAVADRIIEQGGSSRAHSDSESERRGDSDPA